MDNGNSIEVKTGEGQGGGSCCEPSCCCSGGDAPGVSKKKLAIVLLILFAAAAVAANSIWRAKARASAANVAAPCCPESCDKATGGCTPSETNAPQPK